MTPTMRRLVALLAATLAASAATAPGSASAATVFTITGHGYGHGIGLGQYGALGYAQRGYPWSQIVSHYYPGTSLATVPAGYSQTERVLLEPAMTSLAFSAGVRITIKDEGGGLPKAAVLAAGSYTLARGLSPGRWRVLDSTGTPVIINMLGPVDVMPWGRPLAIANTMPLGWAGGQWWGWFRAIPNTADSDFALVENVPMETYLRGVVPSEMPSSWLPQALAAQAVVARSYAYASQHPTSDWDVVDGVGEAYGPAEHWTAATDAAVAATAGQVVLYGGSVAWTFYSASSGGLTDSEVGAWDCGSCGEPYLEPVADPYDSADGLNPYHSWAPQTVTAAGLGRSLGLAAPVVSVTPAIGGLSRRVLSLAVRTSTGGTSDILGYRVQQLLSLRSTYFRITGVTLTIPPRVEIGQGAQLNGSVWPLPSGPVALQRRIGSGPWVTRLSSLHLNAAGAFTVYPRPTGTWSYRLIVPGGIVSPVVTVVAS